MPNLKPIGIILLNEDTGERVLFPVSGLDNKSLTVRSSEHGKIVKTPTPDEVEIQKEKDETWKNSLTGIFRKHKERTKGDLPENPLSK